MTTPRADDWKSRGGYFSWRPAQGDASPVEIFHVEMGDPGAPVLLLIHGWPTSSIDWFEVADQLSRQAVREPAHRTPERYDQAVTPTSSLQ